MSLKTLYRKRTVIWPFYFYTIIRTLSVKYRYIVLIKLFEVSYEKIHWISFSYDINFRGMFHDGK
ncbi:hypothetical protein B9Z08_13010 [Staphylococcus aureus]|nr:hypothetical protein B9Z08_13010 [Staphylococcus aureus]